MAGGKVDYVFKVVLIGDSAVGKSQLLAETNSVWIRKPDSRSGIPQLLLLLRSDILSSFALSRYRAVTNAYYRGAVGAMLVYDLTNRESFDHIPRWLEELRALADKNIVIILIGNKIRDRFPWKTPRAPCVVTRKSS
ncbi:unnamed protein product [Arabis nemorensis]|uniref:Uncharacterized protein n=1 Tax=Arabis nemorensis TaxID=586526 RepID=A0A565C7U2_9BRAS|nr:unnamed protein product [Arabis nemorensis]